MTMHSFTYPLVCSSANVKTFHRVTIGDGWHVPLRIPGPAQATQQSYLRALSPAFRQCEWENVWMDVGINGWSTAFRTLAPRRLAERVGNPTLAQRPEMQGSRQEGCPKWRRGRGYGLPARGDPAPKPKAKGKLAAFITKYYSKI